MSKTIDYDLEARKKLQAGVGKMVVSWRKKTSQILSPQKIL